MTAHGSVRPAQATVLVLADDPELRERLATALGDAGFVVRAASGGGSGAGRAMSDVPALVLLELAAGGRAGLDLCRAVRAETSAPIVALATSNAEVDRVAAFEAGADDYVARPFSLSEVVLRVRSQLRRSGVAPELAGAHVLRCGPVELDVARHEVMLRGQVVYLTPKEFLLLESLLRAEGRLRTRGYLIERVWGTNYLGDTKTLDVHVKRLRAKLESDPRAPELLLTVRGLGYRLVERPVAVPRPHVVAV